jgi:translocation protein SEC62
MVAVILGGVMFPLWPPIMRLGVWYLSMLFLGFIVLFFVIAIIRLIFYVITLVVASPGIWIFPNLFADVGFVRIIVRSFLPSFDLMACICPPFQVESFIPLWEWDVPKKRSKRRRQEAGDAKKEKLSETDGSRPPVADRDDSADSRPASRTRRVTVEDVAEDEE